MANAATHEPPKPHVRSAASDASTPSSSPELAFAMLSHRGRVRHANQDTCAAIPQMGAFVVCDGIGGAAAGEIASRLAAETFLDVLGRPAPAQSRRNAPKTASDHNAAPYPPGHPHTRLHDAVHAANQAVFRHSRKSRDLHGMGTTLVATLLDVAADSRTLWLAHVGDSRCYLFRRDTLKLLTDDHSLVEEQVRAGTLSPREAATSPMRNIITRAIGSQPDVEPDIAAHTMQPGDLFLLASDGLTRELADADILRILLQVPPCSATPALQAACQSLIDAANSHGGRDNITVLLISCL